MSMGMIVQYRTIDRSEMHEKRNRREYNMRTRISLYFIYFSEFDCLPYTGKNKMIQIDQTFD